MQTVVMNFSLDDKVEFVKVNTSLMSPAPDTVAPYLMGLIDKCQASINRGFDFGD
jgi:hypothetical protein